MVVQMTILFEVELILSSMRPDDTPIDQQDQEPESVQNVTSFC